MPTDVERRRAERWTPLPTEALSQVRLRGGREMSVLDVSPLGALILGTTRLLPGTHVDVHVTTTQGRLPVRALVTRCTVSDITADAVNYRGALAFERALDLAGPSDSSGG